MNNEEQQDKWDKLISYIHNPARTRSQIEQAIIGECFPVPEPIRSTILSHKEAIQWLRSRKKMLELQLAAVNKQLEKHLNFHSE